MNRQMRRYGSSIADIKTYQKKMDKNIQSLFKISEDMGDDIDMIFKTIRSGMF